MGIPDDVIRKMSGSAKSDKPSRKTSSGTRKTRQSKNEQESFDLPAVDEKVDDGWTVDPKTGVRYKKLAETQWIPGEPGRSRVTIDEEMPDAFRDMNSAAEVFLAHLRVPPDEKEMERLRKMRSMQERLQREEQEKIATIERQEDAKVDEILKKKGLR